MNKAQKKIAQILKQKNFIGKDHTKDSIRVIKNLTTLMEIEALNKEKTMEFVAFLLVKIEMMCQHSKITSEELGLKLKEVLARKW